MVDTLRQNEFLMTFLMASPPGYFVIITAK